MLAYYGYPISPNQIETGEGFLIYEDRAGEIRPVFAFSERPIFSEIYCFPASKYALAPTARAAAPLTRLSSS